MCCFLQLANKMCLSSLLHIVFVILIILFFLNFSSLFRFCRTVFLKFITNMLVIFEFICYEPNMCVTMSEKVKKGINVFREFNKSKTGVIGKEKDILEINISAEIVENEQKSSKEYEYGKNTQGPTHATDIGNGILSRLIKRYVGDVCEFMSIFGPNAHKMFMQKYKQYGPVYTFSAFNEKMVFLFEVEDIEKLKLAEGRCPNHLDFKHLRRHREDKGYPKGLLVSNGEEWLRQRKILSNPVMLKIGQHVNLLSEVANETMSNIVSRHIINGRGSFKVEQFTRDYSINAFGTVLYGHSFETTYAANGIIMTKFAEMAKNNFEDAKKLMMTPECIMKMHPAWKRHNTRWNFLLDTTMDTIEMHTKGQNQDDESILSYLLKTRKLTEKEIFINLTDLLVASIDTTNTALQWCLYELARHPDVQERVRLEIESVLQDKLTIDRKDLDQMQFLKAVLWETLRLHPVGFFTSRIIQSDVEIRGFNIPAKTNVAISMYVMGRNPSLFPHPDEFIPDRWTSNDPKIRRFPRDVVFGFGPRMCLGRKIAEMEMMLFLIKFCMKFEFSTQDKDIGSTVKLLLCPEKPIEIIVTLREDNTE